MNSDLHGYVDLTDEIISSRGVSFDPERVTLQGCYEDQISAYRAKRLWIETFENCFLLEQGHDFSIRVNSEFDRSQFVLVCEFRTACARYAFWRLTNNQAPEAQYVIETAHIPMCDSRQEEIMRAPDMKSVHDPDSCILRADLAAATNAGIGDLLKRIINKFK